MSCLLKICSAVVMVATLLGSRALASDIGEAKFLGCSETYPALCKVSLSKDLLSAGALQGGKLKNKISLYDGDRLIYQVHSVKAIRLGVTDQAPYQATVSGKWFVEEAISRYVIGRKMRLVAISNRPTQGPSFVTQVNSDDSRGDENRSKARPRRRSNDDRQPARYPEHMMPPVAPYAPYYPVAQPVAYPASYADPRPTPAPAQAPQVAALDKPASASESTMTKVEKWARGENVKDTDRILSLIAKGGTPNSPTGTFGGVLEFLPSQVVPIGLGIGGADSAAFVDKKRGRLRFNNASVTTGLLVGRTGAQLGFMVSYTMINARYTAGDSTAVSADELYITESRKESYQGWTPGLSLRLGSPAGGGFLAMEYGRFISSSKYEKHMSEIVGRYNASFASNKAMIQNVFNVGLGFNF